MTKKKILFICTGNSCRSQMAEGFTRDLRGDEWEAWSAGVEPRELDPIAVSVMAEEGVDISSQRSKSVADLPAIQFDYVMTICDRAKEKCVAWNGKEINLHFGFDDPVALSVNKDENDKIAIYRRVRNMIRDMLEDTLDELSKGK